MRRSIPAVRRAISLPPGRPRRSSAAQIEASRTDLPAEPARIAADAPAPGFHKAAPGATPGEPAARAATYAVAERYCVDVSLVRLRLLRRDDGWSSVAYYVRVYEERPRDGSFAIQLTWTGRGYDYFVTGPAGECRGPR